MGLVQRAPGLSFPADAWQAGVRRRARLGRAEAEVIKSRGTKGKAGVTFTVDPGAGARTAAVCGEWNDWSAGAGVMHRDAEGGSA